MLEAGEKISPAGSRFGDAEAQKGQSHFREDELRDEEGGLGEQNASRFGQDVAADEIGILSAEAPRRANESALFDA